VAGPAVGLPAKTTRAAAGLLLSPAKAFANRVIQPPASCFYRQPLGAYLPCRIRQPL